MKENIVTFKYEQHDVRVIQDENRDLWFIGKDICAVLGLKNVSQAVKKLDENEKLIRKLFVSGQDKNMLTISEPGLYALIIRSNKPEAKPFWRWVTQDMVPSVRKTCFDAVPGNTTPATLVTDNLKSLLDRAKKLEMSGRIFKIAVSIARAAGLRGRAMLIRANAITARTPGAVDCLEELGLEYINEEDWVCGFVEDKCALGEAKQGGIRVSPPELYLAYKDYIAGMGFEPLGKQHFYTQFLGFYPDVKKLRESHGTREYFYGVSLDGSATVKKKGSSPSTVSSEIGAS